MKAGFKTTEFWMTIVSQILAILTLLGFVSAQDAQSLETALGQCVAAVFLFAVNAWVVVQYAKGRVALKRSQAGSPKLVWLLAIVVLGCLGGARLEAGPLLPWRAQIEQRLQDQQRLIAQWIGQQPRPQPPIFQLPIPGDPKQTLPIGGDPKQPLPVPGDPRQTLPTPGDPKQTPPPGGDPRQVMPPAQTYTLRLHAIARPID